ncbi:MAG: hypothetical protein IMZ55_12420 [Acidobacteria bacterium]|nr:hypothetical protein [Acidobacteriota bacterium]
MTLERLLLLLGVGFLVANVRTLFDLGWNMKRRASALLVWPSRKPPFYLVILLIGAALGALLVSNIVTGNLRPGPIFGEVMMFCYYACAVPLSRVVRRGFYTDGVWTDGRFLPYGRIGGLSWREGAAVTLILLVKAKGRALRLVVPGNLYGAARRVLRDKIVAHQIHFDGTGLHLGGHDEREDV